MSNNKKLNIPLTKLKKQSKIPFAKSKEIFMKKMRIIINKVFKILNYNITSKLEKLRSNLGLDKLYICVFFD